MIKYLNRSLWVSLVLIASCSRKPSGTLEVSGHVKNIDKVIAQYPGAFPNGSVKLYLYEVPFEGDVPPVMLDSAVLTNKNNRFSLKGAAHTTGIYDVKIENGPMIPVVNDVSSLTLNIDLIDSDNFYSIEGSEASQKLRDFLFIYGDKRQKLDQAMDNLDSMKQVMAPDSEVLAATAAKNNALEDVNSYVKKFLANAREAVVVSFALGTASNTLPDDDFGKELDSQLQKFPQDKSLTYLKKQYDDRKAQIADMEKRQQENSWVGKKAPDLTLPDPSGKKISISSFRGKYLLVDFWASWCGPCRMENPNVVAAYQRFKDKNFAILGVSLDKDKDAWLKAIRQDHLTWTHVSDLAYWNSKAVSTFNFDGIPFNILIDPDGTIIGESLRGEDLENKLAEVLK